MKIIFKRLDERGVPIFHTETYRIGSSPYVTDKMFIYKNF